MKHIAVFCLVGPDRGAGEGRMRTLRQKDRETKVLILSARSEVEDKVEGLDAGANDYLAKPFSFG